MGDQHGVSGIRTCAWLTVSSGFIPSSGKRSCNIRDERLHLEIDALPFRGQAGGNVNGSAGVAPPESDWHGNDWILPSRIACSLSSTPATARKARSKIMGKSLPRFAARRMIPRQALALK
jgi:hypothetical protein